ncbi:MAG: hypothetical protein KDA46_03575 [Parvularculaceae bacterium]|nr:hypothetical protein [Parvularculaceae bacterium]
MASRSRGTSEPAAQKRAVIRDSVWYCADNGKHLAPRGEYDIESKEGCVGLRSRADAKRFTLSFDAFVQHVNEGRITLIAANDSRKP